MLSFTVITIEYFGALAGLVRRHGRDPRPRHVHLQVAATACNTA